MKASEMNVGDMFLFNPKAVGLDDTDAEVYVKLREGIVQGWKASVFVKNSAMVRVSIQPGFRPSITDTWGIRDNYFERQLASGAFILVDDLGEAERKADELNIRLAVVELEF